MQNVKTKVEHTKKKSEKVMEERNGPQDQRYPFILKCFLQVNYSSTTQSAPSDLFWELERKPSVRVSKGARFDVVPNLKVTGALQVEAPPLLRLQPPIPRPNHHPLHTQMQHRETQLVALIANT